VKSNYLNLREAADYLGLSPRALREKCGRNLISHTRIDRLNWRFSVEDLEAYLQRNRFVAKSVYDPKPAKTPRNV
jgi:excisionase family DNA binding protein